MNVPEITPQDARARLDGENRPIYLDVRTPAEFQAGRPPGAINVPVALVNPRTGQMELNPHFLSVVESLMHKNAEVIVGCKSGQRSEAAARLMIEGGYPGVSSMVGGFAGEADATGQVIVEGWSTLGLPEERGDAGERGYDAVCRRLGNTVGG